VEVLLKILLFSNVNEGSPDCGEKDNTVALVDVFAVHVFL
jgi:hypothetical protein